MLIKVADRTNITKVRWSQMFGILCHKMSVPCKHQIPLTRSMRDSETSIDFVQGPPSSRREQVKRAIKGPMKCTCMLTYNTLLITNVAKRLYLNMCHIFYYNFSVNFLQRTWIRPQNIFQTKILVVTSLVNHHPVNIISKDKGMLDSQG